MQIACAWLSHNKQHLVLSILNEPICELIVRARRDRDAGILNSDFMNIVTWDNCRWKLINVCCRSDFSHFPLHIFTSLHLAAMFFILSFNWFEFADCLSNVIYEKSCSSLFSTNEHFVENKIALRVMLLPIITWSICHKHLFALWARFNVHN